MSDFNSLASILRYLKLCVSSTIADEVRLRYARGRHESLEDIEYDEATSTESTDKVVEALSVLDLWRILQEELYGDEERALIYFTYILGMKPAEISDTHHQLFPTADDVYRIKRNVVERLRRNQRLQQLVRRDWMA